MYTPQIGDIIRHKSISERGIGVIGFTPTLNNGTGYIFNAFFHDNKYCGSSIDYEFVHIDDLSDDDNNQLDIILKKMPSLNNLIETRYLMNNNSPTSELDMLNDTNTQHTHGESSQGAKMPIIDVELLTNGIADVEYTPAIIKFDIDKYVERTKEIIAPLEGYQVTEENMPESKTHAANLNKFMKAINDTAIAVDKAASIEITKFRDAAKELIAVIKPIHAAIDNQVKNFDAVQKRNKEIEVNALIKQALAKVPELRPHHAHKLNVLPEYLNKSTTLNKVVKSIDERLLQIIQDQKNEILAEELEEQKRNERITIIENLNAAYSGKLPNPITFKECSGIDNKELQPFFEQRAKQYAEEQERQSRAQQVQTTERQQRMPPQVDNPVPQPPAIEDRTVRIKGKNLDGLINKLLELGYQVTEVKL